MKRFQSLLLTFFLLYAPSVDCQNIDSLQRLLSSQNDKESAATLNVLAGAFHNSNSEKAAGYAQKAFNLACKTRNRKIEAQAAVKLGDYHYHKTHYDSANYYFDYALRVSRNISDKHTMINALNGIADVLSQKLQYSEALAALGEAWAIAKENDMQNYYANIYNGFGNVFDRMGQPDSAVSCYFLAKKYYSEAGDERNAAQVLNNMGTLLINTEKYREALKYLKEAMEINRRKNIEEALILNFNNIAICYRKTDSLQLAREFLLQTLNLARKREMKFERAAAFMTLGNVLTDLKKYDTALLYLDSSLAICKAFGLDYGILLYAINRAHLFREANMPDSAVFYYRHALMLVDSLGLKYEKSKIYLGLSNLYSQQGRADSALVYYKQYIGQRDYINQQDVNQKIAELETKYENQKKQKEITELNRDLLNLKAKQRLYLIFILLFVFGVIFWVVYLRYKRRNRLLKLTLAKIEKEKLFAELMNKEKELMVNAMHIVRLNEVSLDVAKKLKTLSSGVPHKCREMVREIVSGIKSSTVLNTWKEFETRFENVHQGFYKALRELHPELTPNEIKICSFIRLNMTSKDISILTNRSLRTIECSRNRIRKKLNLGTETTLAKYLLSI